MKKILLFLLILVVTLSAAYSTNYISALAGYEELGIITYSGDSISVQGTSLTLEGLHINEYTNKGFSFNASYILPLGINLSTGGKNLGLSFTNDDIKSITETAAVVNSSLLFFTTNPHSNFINAMGFSCLNVYEYTNSSLISLFSATGRWEYNTGITPNLIFRAGIDYSIPLVMSLAGEEETQVFPAIALFAVGAPLHVKPYIGLAYSL